MKAISDEKINEIRNSADIVSIISDYIPLKLHGKNYFGICPFHDDHSPSMSVSPDRQLFKCFVCNKGGNVFTFIKDYENISYIEAVKRVADKIGIPLSIDTYSNKSTKFNHEYEIMDYATKIFQNNLYSKEGSKAREYLKERNITENIIKDFKIGLALENRTHLRDSLKNKYDINELDELGLITKDGINSYDKFYNRIMIPLTNEDNKVVGYTGRIYNGETDTAKYVNTMETKIYKKGHILFNYYNAKPFIREEKKAIIVEGNMDAIRMYSSGVKNVLALMGTVITDDQINMLKKLRVPIILMLDNDNAGSLATINVGDVLIKNELQVLVVRLEGAKDPDEYIVKYGIDKFNETIKNAMNYFDYKMIYLKQNKNLNNTEELVSYVKDVLKMVKDEDNLTKEITLQKLSKEYGLDYDVLKGEVEFKEEKVQKKEIKEIPIKEKKDTYKLCVDKIFYYMMNDSKYVSIFNNRLGYLKNKEERYLIGEIEHFIKIYGKINLADFITYAENDDKIRDFVNIISSSVYEDELSEQTFIEYINRIKTILNKEEIDNIKKELRNTIDAKKQEELLKKLQGLVKKMSEING